MSAPTPAPGEAGPRADYYPDPSIPGYIRYWNGAAWVPGTSRPAPKGGDPMPEPPASAVPARTAFPAAPAPSPAAPTQVAVVDETGPVFFDEEPRRGAHPAEPAAHQPSDLHGSRPEPATAWQANTARQTGFGGEPDRRISWGNAPQAAGQTAPQPAAHPAEHAAADGGAPAAPAPAVAQAAAPADPVRPAARDPWDGVAGPGGLGTTEATSQGEGTLSLGPQRTAPAAEHASAAEAEAAPEAPVGPVTTGPGGGAASWAQEAHRLTPERPARTSARTTPRTRPEPSPRAEPAEAPDPRTESAPEPTATPWRPVDRDPFQAAAQARAAARPAGLGRRLVARAVDTAVLGAAVAAASVPLVGAAVDHVQAKIDAAELTGETRTVWLLDGTTGGHAAAVLGLLLVLGVLYEAVPTGRWGRTLGKKLCGIRVTGIESHDPPGFGAALGRWLVYCLLGLLAVGVLNVLWCLFDRPWRQCWHDKAAGTFVAGPSNRRRSARS
ncbi:RDD family protein [Streptomyces sp. NPDC060194]|uniref:RDD family protein n=1 Tax=Streptomyces sp. NPDC060194 TaxID=3347069 RepID=UPI003666E5FE